jgi:serine/threonine-protein kinase
MGLLDNLRSILSAGKVDVRSRFEILREAISGTMSAFYMARDRHNQNIVGLKLLDPVKTALLEARFTGLNRPSEGEIASRFDHPSIVRTLEHGLTTESQQYIVMEFLPGSGLNSLLLTRSRMLKGKRLSLLRQAAEALHAVHEAGFIHRDICPRNFVVAPDGASLKLIDFGLAVPATPPFMQPGNRTGTPNYMAPELVRRKRSDQRLDIFSFGVSAFELFTYDLPWPRGTEGQAAQAAMAHGAVDPVDIRTLRRDLHPKLADAIHACIEADVAKRPATMLQFLEMLSDVESETI